jgi:hypothetical protein
MSLRAHKNRDANARSCGDLGKRREKRNGRGVIAGSDSESLREMSEKLKLHLNKK